MQKNKKTQKTALKQMVKKDCRKYIQGIITSGILAVLLLLGLMVSVDRENFRQRKQLSMAVPDQARIFLFTDTEEGDLSGQPVANGIWQGCDKLCIGNGRMVSVYMPGGCANTIKMNQESLRRVIYQIIRSQEKEQLTESNSRPAVEQPTESNSRPAVEQPTENNSNSLELPNEAFVDEVIRLVNVERNKVGLRSLSKEIQLCKAANVRAGEIVTLFAHTRPNGKDCFSVLSEYNINYRTAGENIAWGQTSPQQVVDGWMNSPGHRANILGSGFEKIGVGVVEEGGRYYWAQMFIG